MENINWGCLGIQIAITGIAFYLINSLILYKTKEDGIMPNIKRDDMNLFLSLLVAILAGYFGTTLVKSDCKQESRLF